MADAHKQCVWPKSDAACVTQRFALKMYQLYHWSYLRVLPSQGRPEAPPWTLGEVLVADFMEKPLLSVSG